MARSEIEWLARPGTIPWSWNLVGGCAHSGTRGCDNCWSCRLAATRLRHHPLYQGTAEMVNGRPRWTGQINLHEGAIDIRTAMPLRWRKPRTVFVCSTGDLFHPEVPMEFRLRAWDVMYLAADHTFIVLTKRPQGLPDFINEYWRMWRMPDAPVVLPNVWLGVSCEDQAAADARVPPLLATPAEVRFVSCEPLLGPILLDRAAHDPAMLGWVIAGGESGPGARPMHPACPRSLRDQARDAGIPFFMKQMARRAPIPPDLAVREFPHGEGKG